MKHRMYCVIVKMYLLRLILHFRVLVQHGLDVGLVRDLEHGDTVDGHFGCSGAVPAVESDLRRGGTKVCEFGGDSTCCCVVHVNTETSMPSLGTTGACSLVHAAIGGVMWSSGKSMQWFSVA